MGDMIARRKEGEARTAMSNSQWGDKRDDGQQPNACNGGDDGSSSRMLATEKTMEVAVGE